MGQIDIIKTLKEKPKDWFTTDDLINKTQTSRSSVLRCMKSLWKRNEINYIAVSRGNELFKKHKNKNKKQIYLYLYKYL